ncbi:MAG: flagellar hook-associated protein FlgK [Rhodocyclaceae bacterium]|nr:flagellar hook-associated protein FlgK [Rhodocyclaceae bacterium]
MSFAGVTEAGLSGIYAAGTQLATASHNISNASLEGYHRQVVVLTPREPQLRNGFFVGNGVDVQTVQRVFDSFIDQQLRDASADTAFLDTLELQTGQVDAALSSDQASLLPTVQSFFTALSAVAASPTSTPARQLVISNGSVMADRFASLQDRLNSIRRGVEDGISSAVSDLNSFALQLAKINDLVQQSALDTRGLPAADLLDQRDTLVNKISGLVNASVVYRADGSATVSVADGRALVEGNAARPIGASFNPEFPAEKVITVTVGDTTTFLRDSAITGGRIGALLEVRNKTLNFADGQLGRIAVAITSAINVQHQRGFDQNGVGGARLFQDQTDIGTATPSARNNINSTAVLAGAIVDASQLTGLYYGFDFDGTTWRITSSDGRFVAPTITPGDPADPERPDPAKTYYEFEGLRIAMSGVAVAGDHFDLRPTAGLAGGMVLNSDIAKNPRLIAASSSSDPRATGDGNNAQAMADIQRSTGAIGGANTLAEGYSQLASTVGVQAASAKTRNAAQTALVQQLKSQQQAVSGINLDEEAANLLRYQQAYQASSKLIALAGRLLDSILAIN